MTKIPVPEGREGTGTWSTPPAPARLVGAEIKRIRTERGLTLRGLAEHCGLSADFLSLAELGINSISLTSLFALASALDVGAVELLGAAGRGSPQAYAITRRDAPDALRVVMGEREPQPGKARARTGVATGSRRGPSWPR
ncbi:helix-turn-helix transcriptional regulator [Streptomyces sp. NPDC050617]|uniref:helix-turn-helix domain-containing protein n=1 Tax=Streptomyces sp. NPDC050617 TaxID=3154628 RepID=UPI0034383474